MSDPVSSEELDSLRALVPLHTLPDDVLAELLDEVDIATVKRGQVLFKQGDTDHEHVYLLKGRVALLSDNSVIDRIDAGTDTARFPLAHQLPRKYSVRAEGKSRIVRIDSHRISDLLARTQSVDYQVDDFDAASEDDWMSMLLQSSVLQQVPAANLQRVIMSVEQVEVEKGEDLIRQGDPGDYYYMLTQGRAVVRRDNDDGKGVVELATLGPGNAFGEDALLSDKPRNSTVTMAQDGVVLRLSKDDFVKLIRNPLTEHLGMARARTMVNEGAVWVDVRDREQYEQNHFDGAINLPFESLRYHTDSLAQERHYIVYSNSGARATAAAFLLTERGFEVSVLKGGLKEAVDAAAPSEAVAAPTQAPQPGQGDETMQRRVQDAEARAKALEEQLKSAQRERDSNVVERDRDLAEVRQAVDEAQRRLVETEGQKRDAQEAQRKAYSEMEALTGNLEKLQSERSSLLERMSEIKGLDKQLQERLEKAERELIRERERAESATQNLDELSRRLDEEIERRDAERGEHAHERGELKDELTELRMELEQANLDLEEMRAQLTERQNEKVAVDEALAAAQQQSQDRELAFNEQHDALQERIERLGKERNDVQNQLGDAIAQADKDAASRLELEQRLTTNEQQRDEAQQQIDALGEQRDALRAEVDQARAEAERAETESGQKIESLQGEIGQLREQQAELQSEIASGNAQAGTAIEQAQARIAELEQQLDEQTRGAQQTLDDTRAQLDALGEELKLAQAESQTLKEARDAETQAAAEQRAEGDAAATQIRELQDQLRAQAEQSASELDAVARQRDEHDATINTLREEVARLGEAQNSDDSERDRLRESDEQARQRIAELEHKLAEAVDETATAQQVLEDERERATAERIDAEAGLNAQLEKLRGENASLSEQLAAETSDDATLEQLRSDLAETKQHLDEREIALRAARDEQSELIEALNTASAERESMQLALSERENDQARLVDLEKQVGEALRTHEKELLDQENEQIRLREQLDKAEGQRRALGEEVQRLTELVENDEGEKVAAERDGLRTELSAREYEVEQLRTVIEEYVDQIRAAQSGGGDDPSEVAALRAELEMVREQAVRDVAQMREQLATAETQSRRLQQADDREAVSLEAMRQQIEALELSLAERQRELTVAETSQHELEDKFEDAHRRIEDMQRDLDKARAEADEAIVVRREAETAREQLQEALEQQRENTDEENATDLRDARLQLGNAPIGMDSVTGRRGLKGGLFGAILVFAALEAASFATGNGELVSLLLRLAGQ